MSTHGGNPANFRDGLGLELQPDQNKHEIQLNLYFKIYFYLYISDKSISSISKSMSTSVRKMNEYFVLKYIF